MKVILIVVSIILMFAFFAYMGVLVYQSDPSFNLSNLDLSINKAALFGDSFGVFASLFSGVALIGLLYTILQQGEELTLQREEMSKSVATQLRNIHISIQQMAMNEKCLEDVWENDKPITDICFKQKSYVNLVLSNWEMQFDHKLLSEDQIEETLNTYMLKPYFQEFWKSARGFRQKMAEKSNSKNSKSFHKLAEKAYNKALQLTVGSAVRF